MTTADPSAAPDAVEAASEAPEDKRVLVLQEPVNLAGNVTTELRFQALKGRHMREMPAGETLNVGHLLTMAALLSAQPTRLMDLLCPADVKEVCNRMADFMAGSPKSGAASTRT